MSTIESEQFLSYNNNESAKQADKANNKRRRSIFYENRKLQEENTY